MFLKNKILESVNVVENVATTAHTISSLHYGINIFVYVELLFYETLHTIKLVVELNITYFINETSFNVPLWYIGYCIFNFS